MRILHYMWLGVVLAACSGDQTTSDILQITAQETALSVGNTTVMQALLVDPSTNASMPAGDVSWSEAPDGIVMLSQQGDVQQVTAVGSGQVVVTADGYGQTAKIGFSVTP
ncbi:MAG TPA: hypothetical protein VGG74_34030 [Kofleriaceae bacterium]